MTAPTHDRLEDGMGQLRDALDQAPQAAREEVKQSLADTVVTLGRQQKLYMRVTLALVTLLLLIFAGAMIIVFNRINTQDRALTRTEGTIQAFQAQLDAANKKLVASGLPPVQAARDPVPGSADDAKLSTAAATATTLAALPKEVLIKPTATELAQAVASYMLANPITVPSDQIIASLAAYLAAHPIPPGLAGPTGPPGRTPTAEEISAAFRQEVAANPQILCPLGGTYGNREVLLVGGGSTQQFGCFGADQGAPSGSTGGTTTNPPDTSVAPTPTPTPQAPPSGSGGTTPTPSSTNPSSTPSGPLGGIFGGP